MEKLEMGRKFFMGRKNERQRADKRTQLSAKEFSLLFRTYYLCISQLLVMEVETTISR